MTFRINILLEQMLKFCNASSHLLLFMADMFFMPQFFNFSNAPWTVCTTCFGSPTSFLIFSCISIIHLLLLSMALIIVSKIDYRYNFNGPFNRTSQATVHVRLHFEIHFLHFSPRVPISITSSSCIPLLAAKHMSHFFLPLLHCQLQHHIYLKQTHQSYHIVLNYHIVQLQVILLPQNLAIPHWILLPRQDRQYILPTYLCLLIWFKYLSLYKSFHSSFRFIHLRFPSLHLHVLYFQSW